MWKAEGFSLPVSMIPRECPREEVFTGIDSVFNVTQLSPSTMPGPLFVNMFRALQMLGGGVQPGSIIYREAIQGLVVVSIQPNKSST